MLIMIVGNISSGKTTTSLALKKALKRATFLCLDDFRRKYNTDSSLSGELKAQENLITRIKMADPKKYTILECTGTGKWFNYYKSVYKGEVLVVEIVASKALCVGRTSLKFTEGYVWPPLPKEWAMPSNMSSIKTSINWMSDKIPNGELKIKASNTVDYNVETILEKIKGEKKCLNSNSVTKLKRKMVNKYDIFMWLIFLTGVVSGLMIGMILDILI